MLSTDFLSEISVTPVSAAVEMYSDDLIYHTFLPGMTSIMVLLEGKLNSKSNKFRLKVGDALCAGGHAFMPAIGISAGSDTKVLIMTAEISVFNDVPFLPLISDQPFVLKSSPAVDAIRELVSEELESEAPFAEHFGSAVVEMFFYQYLRGIFTEKSFELPEALYDDTRLRSVLEFIQAEYDNDLSNKRIANLIDVAEEYAGQYFKKCLHMNLQDYIEQRRIEKATELIQSGQYQLAEVAKRSGFQDATYFSRRYKQRTGIAAKDIRKIIEMEIYI
jgi:AraC-like DNA-binding protein